MDKDVEIPDRYKKNISTNENYWLKEGMEKTQNKYNGKVI